MEAVYLMASYRDSTLQLTLEFSAVCTDDYRVELVLPQVRDVPSPLQQPVREQNPRQPKTQVGGQALCGKLYSCPVLGAAAVVAWLLAQAIKFKICVCHCTNRDECLKYFDWLL